MKSKSFRRNLIVSLAFIVCALFGAVFAINAEKQVNAEETSTAPVVNFAMVGAEVRLVDPCGLRFVAAIPKDDYESLADKGITYGLVFVPEDYLSKYGELNYENVFGESARYSTSPTDGKGLMVNQTSTELYFNAARDRYELRVALVNIKEANLNRNFAAKSYYIYNDGVNDKYVFESDYKTRSIVSVSVAALNDETASLTDEQKAVLNNYVQTGYLADTEVKTAAHLYAVMQSTLGKTYTLKNDIDMTGYKFGANAEKAIKFKGTLDGNGHKVYGISFESNLINGQNGPNGNFVWNFFDGKLSNISFEIDVSLKWDSDNPANNDGWPDSGLIRRPENNTVIENVYTKVQLDGKNAKYGESSSKLGEAWFFVLGYTSGLSGIKISNVINNVTFSNNNGVGKAAIVRTLYPSYEITNSFIVTNEVNCSVIGMAADATSTNTVKIGAEELFFKKGEMHVGKYVYSNISSFVMDSNNYKQYFTADMWKDILVYSDEDYFNGYIAVNSASALYTAMQDVSGNKYYLKNDIDMTGYKFGANAEKQIKFKGTLDGNGHKIYGISFESNLINGQDGVNTNAVWRFFSGKLCNVSFEIAVSLKWDSDNLANNYGWPDSGLIMGTEKNCGDIVIEDVYTKVQFDGKNAKYGTSDKLGEAWFFVLGYGSNADSIKVNNVVNEVAFINNNGVGKAAIVRTLYSVYEVTNSFVVTNEVNCGLFGSAGNDVEAIVKNGTEELTYKKGALYVGKYVYDSISALLADENNYRQYFSAAMWDKIFA